MYHGPQMRLVCYLNMSSFANKKGHGDMIQSIYLSRNISTSNSTSHTCTFYFKQWASITNLRFGLSTHNTANFACMTYFCKCTCVCIYTYGIVRVFEQDETDTHYTVPLVTFELIFF